MGSSAKTPHLHLNDWAGSDKPKKDDFNEDNQRVDTAFGKLTGNVDILERDLSQHRESGGHVTDQERAAWNNGGQFVAGSYVGNGAVTQSVSLDFAPRLGLVFTQSRPPVFADSMVYATLIYSAFATTLGASDGLTLTQSGFDVVTTPTPHPDTSWLRLNDKDITYFYAMWP